MARMLRALLVLFVAVVPAFAQGRLSSWVPPETPLIVEFERLDHETAWKRICAEPEVQRFLDGLGAAIARGIEGQRKQGPDFFQMFGLQPADFSGISIARGGLALIGLDPARGMYPDSVLHIEFREGGEKVEKILGGFRAAAMMVLGAHEGEKLGDATLWTLRVGEREPCHLLRGKDLFFASSKARLKATLEQIDGENGATLAGDAEFLNAQASMKAERFGFRLFARPAAIGRMVAPLLGENAERVRRALAIGGFDTITSISVADVPAGHLWRTELCIRHGKDAEFTNWFGSEPTSHRFAKRAPERPLLYFGERYDLARAMASMGRMLQAVDPDGHREAGEAIAEFNRVAGLDLKNDLLASLGDEWSAYVGGHQPGALVPDMVYLVSLKDRARFEKSVRALFENRAAWLALLGEDNPPELRHRRIRFREQNIDSIEITAADGAPGLILPSWTVGEDYVAFALWPQPLKHMLARRGSLEDNEGWKRVRQSVPDGAASGGYADLPRLFAWGYETAALALQGLQGAANRELAPYGTKLNFHDLPRAEVITRHLSPTVTYSVSRDGVTRMGYVSPCGVSLVAGAVIGLGAAAGVAEAARQEGIEVAERAAEEEE